MATLTPEVPDIRRTSIRHMSFTIGSGTTLLIHEAPFVIIPFSGVRHGRPSHHTSMEGR
jgi:hypothetical protein